jgi:hypothetical protein
MTDLRDFISVLQGLRNEKGLDSEITSILCAVASQSSPETQVLLAHLGWNGSNFKKPIDLEAALDWSLEEVARLLLEEDLARAQGEKAAVVDTTQTDSSPTPSHKT